VAGPLQRALQLKPSLLGDPRTPRYLRLNEAARHKSATHIVLEGMSINLRRALLGILAFVGLYTGGWAYFAPEHWYANFPGFGFSWLPQLGPYNMHLAKDDGAMFLALAVLSLFTLRHARNAQIVMITACAWLVFNVLHLIYHLQHLHVYGTTDKILNVVLLGFLLLITVGLLMPVEAKQRSARTDEPDFTSRTD
jgi:hypothetical protein